MRCLFALNSDALTTAQLWYAETALAHRHGGKVVFLSRFIALLLAIAAVLAGINCMEWRRFLVFNASGGVVWAVAYGMAACSFGERLERLHGPVALLGRALAGVACFGAFWWLRRHEAALVAEANRALPGPLPPRD